MYPLWFGRSRSEDSVRPFDGEGEVVAVFRLRIGGSFLAAGVGEVAADAVDDITFGELAVTERLVVLNDGPIRSESVARNESRGLSVAS